LLVALLRHIFHHLFLLLPRLLHVFLVHALAHLTHQKCHTNHDYERVLQVREGVKWRLLLKVLEAAARLQLKRVLQPEILALAHAEQVCFSVFARSKIFVHNFYYDGLKVII
jgi:hypothetical protein